MMIFDKLEYSSIFAKYIVKYLEEQKTIGHNMFYTKYILRDFDIFLENNNIDNNIKFSKEITTKWLEKKETECYASRKNRAVILNLFLKFLGDYIDDIFIIDTKQYYSGEKYVPFIFSNEQIKSLFIRIKENFQSNNLNQEIFEIVINILYCCGTRITETLSIKIKDICISEKYIIIQNGKGNKERIVPINDLIVELLDDFINRYCQNYNEEDYIFKNPHTNKPISRVTILEKFHKVCNELNISTNNNKFPRIHDLRHTYIVHCITKLELEHKNINTYLPILSTMVGHEDINNTMYYLRFTKERIKIINDIENNSKVIIPNIGDNHAI